MPLPLPDLPRRRARREWTDSPARPVAHALLMLLLVMTAPATDPSPFRPVFTGDSPAVIAHRGASRLVPDNSAAALDRAIADGCPWAEIDVRRTADGVHVLCHPPAVSIDGHERAVEASTLGQLRAFRAGRGWLATPDGEPLLTLPEALQRCRGRLKLWIDAKTADPVQLGRELEAAGMLNDVVVGGPPSMLTALQPLAGRVALVAPWVPDQPLPSGAAVVEIRADAVTPDRVRRAREAGRQVIADTLGGLDTPAHWSRVTVAGADAVQTDLPEEVLAGQWRQRVSATRARISLHRGAGRYAPENTLAAFSKATALGADWVEFDVRTTRDGHHVLLHDRTLDRTTDGTGPVSERTLADVAQLSAGRPFGPRFADLRVPTVDQFLQAVDPAVGLYWDAKDLSVEALAAYLARPGVGARSVVYQSPDYLARLRAVAPGVRLLPPLRDPAGLDELVRTLQPYAVDVAWQHLSPGLVARCHALGILVFADGLGLDETLESYRHALRCGIDVLQTDHPLLAWRAVAEVSVTSAPRGITSPSGDSP